MTPEKNFELIVVLEPKVWGGMMTSKCFLDAIFQCIEMHLVKRWSFSLFTSVGNTEGATVFGEKPHQKILSAVLNAEP